jgi:hypothetical protein
VFKKVSLAVVAVALMTGSAMANDLIDSLDLASVSDANNAVVEATFDVNVDQLADNTSNDEAVEACFRRFGWGGYCGYNSYCYSPCYSYCYYPSYYCYRPVCYYQTYTYCYPLYHWGFCY